MFIEEPSSEKPIKSFVQKILGRQVGIVLRVKSRGNLLDEEKIASHIHHDILLEHNDISKFIVCVDSECTPESKITETTSKIEAKLKTRINQPLNYVVVVHAFEGWLLSDPACIGKYLGPRIKIKIPASASKVCKPKEYMHDIFRKADRYYHYTIENARIAEHANPKTMAKNSQSFKRFYDKIKDP